MKKIITSIAVSAVVVFTGCGDTDNASDYNDTEYNSSVDPSTIYGVAEDYNTTTTDYDYNDTYTLPTTTTTDDYVIEDTPVDYTTTSDADLGTLVTDDGTTSDYTTDTSYTTTSGEVYDLESFKAWYATTCNGEYNPSLYDATQNKYNGTIDCQDKNLYSVDLSYLGIFDSIYKIDLSHNHLTTLDLSPLGHMKVINILDLSYNELDNSLDLSPLYNLEAIDELWINNNNISYTYEERVDLYRNLPNTKDDTVKFKISK